MTQISYPSEVVPGPPRMTLDMPEGWTRVWAPDTLIAIRDGARGADHFPGQRRRPLLPAAGSLRSRRDPRRARRVRRPAT
ncbi:hypothetical protein LP422_21580 [Janibacter limosus]|uniref:Uncharacterized protein n=1 Tax=Janibacter limosus TaxID=53458 RepID=A0AC61U4B9_9MICO|nr:hypothetical protein [Janibacter limosus]UUZ44833.1 hypothetical protein LP422_21580 [Janibacter limosus]